MPPEVTATADWVTLAELDRDPFPLYARLRAEQPVAWVPAVNRWLVTRYADCHLIEGDQATFSADEAGSLMKRSMGHSMLRKDDPEHDRERQSYGKRLRPSAIKQTWQTVFEANANALLADVVDVGPGADLIATFAAPYAAENLRAVMGFENATQIEMQRWSQSLIDGTGNYADDAAVWHRSADASAEVDAAIDEMLPHFRKRPNGSLLSGLANMIEPLTIESIRANVKMTIGGGLNETRDALGVALWALLERPDELAQVQADLSLCGAVFDEAIRWIAPIGMYPRQTTREVELGGVVLPAGARLGVVIGSANRDDAQFDDAAEFDINRQRRPHLAFGGGTHYCIGAWIARAQVASVALPLLLRRLPGFRIEGGHRPTVTGWVFRAVRDLRASWTPGDSHNDRNRDEDRP